MKSTNPLWRLFSSVQLAIFTFFALASTSIIGTIIPQHRPLNFYTDAYGSYWAQFFFVLDIPDMYGSWWFTTLLFILCLNLIICSIDRFPITQKKVTAANLSFSFKKIESMPCVYSFHPTTTTTNNSVISLLTNNGWQMKQAVRDSGTLYFGQKYAWSHYGVYLVHMSIIIIFIGALIGNFLGFKGSVMIPELGNTDKIYSQLTSDAIDLGFEVRCDRFDIEYYDTGMPKTYRSHLTISKDGKAMVTKNIEVNKPLTYKGITFYQASFEEFQSFIVNITEQKSGITTQLTADFQQQTELPDQNLKFGILNAVSTDKHVNRVKVWVSDGITEPVTLWLDNDTESVLSGLNKEYKIAVKQMYATGLQVTKDPGVWFVYIGCMMLLLGLYIAFFISHQKIWLILKNDNSLILAGSCNKNMIGFNNRFTKIKSLLESTL